MRLTSPVTVGRADELALIEAGLTAARKGGGQAVFLIGEAGIGKSRLAEECSFLAFQEGMAVLRSRSRTIGGARLPFGAVTEALLSHFRFAGPPRDPGLAPYRRALSGLLPDWRDGEARAEPASLIEVAEAVLRVLCGVRDGPGPQ